MLSSQPAGNGCRSGDNPHPSLASRPGTAAMTRPGVLESSDALVDSVGSKQAVDARTSAAINTIGVEVGFGVMQIDVHEHPESFTLRGSRPLPAPAATRFDSDGWAIASVNFHALRRVARPCDSSL